MSKTTTKRRGLQIWTREKPVVPHIPMRNEAELVASRVAQGVPAEYYTGLGGAGGGLLFTQEPADDQQLTLGAVQMAPHYIIPHHSHTADCLYYVSKGEIHLGKVVIEAGNGFFVPADAPYGYQAGPEGAEVLEFRASFAGLQTRWSESPEGWQKVLDNGRANRGVWTAAGFGPPVHAAIAE